MKFPPKDTRSIVGKAALSIILSMLGHVQVVEPLKPTEAEVQAEQLVAP